ncbi:hypothetical protein O181_083630 [Austropuccinia psidii MF-1]|uniref:Rho-GAP domain-containing protein n=1 Tax=Austropuccinia psidii MF-1 TaxID=1389203 RepID=A0A9Q3FNJ0_9BASI|nr:hypothetical protein [Austropuccinia psidii MF-1]
MTLCKINGGWASPRLKIPNFENLRIFKIQKCQIELFKTNFAAQPANFLQAANKLGNKLGNNRGNNRGKNRRKNHREESDHHQIDHQVKRIIPIGSFKIMMDCHLPSLTPPSSSDNPSNPINPTPQAHPQHQHQHQQQQQQQQPRHRRHHHSFLSQSSLNNSNNNHHHTSNDNNKSHSFHSTVKQLSKLINKSKISLNHLINRNKPLYPQNNHSSDSPITLNSPPPILPSPLINNLPNSPQLKPLPQTSSSASSSSGPHFTHPNWSIPPLSSNLTFKSHSPPDNLSLTSLSPPMACHSGSSNSPRTSWRLSHSLLDSPQSNHQSHWFNKLQRPKTTLINNSNDQNSLQTSLSSFHGHSPSSFRFHPNKSLPLKQTNHSSPLINLNKPNNTLRPIFAIPIKDALELSKETYHGIWITGHIPTIVHKCGERLKTPDGMTSRGIFRINGNIKRMKELEEIFMDPSLGYGKKLDLWHPTRRKQSLQVNQPHQTNKQEINQIERTEPYFTVHDIAGVLRRYLWALPEPLIPFNVTVKLIEIWRKDSNKETLRDNLEETLKSILKIEHLVLLNYLLDFLGQFSIWSEKNLMTSKNLAIVYQPGIMPILEEEIMPGIELNDYLKQIDEVQEILGFLINQFALYYSIS